MEAGVDPNLKILSLSLLYQIYDRREEVNFFYTNDFKVIIDTIIRELFDLPLEDEVVRIFQKQKL